MSRWPLRRTLVVATVTLVALASLFIGFVSVLSVQSLMINRVDEQLHAALLRSSSSVDATDGLSLPSVPSAPDFLRNPGQSPGTLGVIIRDGAFLFAGYLEGDSSEPLRDVQLDPLLTLVDNGPATTVNLGSDLGDYRVLAIKTSDGASLVMGLPLADTARTVRELGIVVVLVTLAAIVLAAAAAFALVRFALRPLERVATTASEVSAMQLDRGEVALHVRVPDEDVDERSEVGLVAASMNRMLGHISHALTARQASENKVRAFVSDASHELRTPLASIRGYAELTRLSGETLPPDTSHALDRIESEAKRMTTIVEDLLLLARLDEGRELASDPVDLVDTLTNAVSDARAAAPDHDWVLDVPDDEVTVAGDTHRLYEVVANLLANARVHTPAGTRVDVALARETGDDGERAVITVKDDGPGIDPGIVDTVFERFVRGDSSRARATGSTGLGLAIVSAVIDAHGGSVSVASRPGRTEFRIELPTPAPVGPTGLLEDRN